MASTTKIKINLEGIPTLTRKQELYSLMFGNVIHFVRIVDSRNGYIVLPKTSQDADKLMSPDFRRKLKTRCEPQMPLETKAKMTIVIKKVDSYITSHSNEEIKEELVRQLKLQVDEVYKMPQHGIVKIRFPDIQTANKIKEQGLILYNYSINPAQIEEERFTRVIQCMNCYEYGHVKGKCTKKNSEKCSECGQTGHRFTACKSTTKKCLNCGGDHRTLSGACPIRRKEITKVEEKKQEKQVQKENRLLSEVVKNTAKATAKVEKTIEKTAKATAEITKTAIKETQPPIMQLPNNLAAPVLSVESDDKEKYDGQ
ncbi:uncharacterized protein LOC122267746 [Penaeus japonicus]|uniref:uncharacterized protein LOC122267746 n=1 Tax=Penaeus japonicus TaxID=27405 RepID=UPI001C7128A4|nr:uncharacterized protein LOC122267746 [Penaeus japonicus]